MKLAKKFMTLALATALGVGCATVGVSAAGSRTNAITVSDEQSAIYEIVQKLEESESFKELQTELPEVADAFAKVNEGKMEVEEFKDVLKTLADETTDETVKAALEELVEKLEGKEFVTGFDEFKVIDSDKAEKNADGKYEVEISVPSITDTMENIQLVAYSKEDAKKWQIVDPISVDKENKTLEVALDDGAFFTVVADAE